MCRRRVATAVLALIVISCFIGESSEALSTFGKSDSPSQPETSRAAAPQPRACNRQAECAGISSSSCVRTHYDSVTRCLCGDNSSPINGQCENQPKNLYHVCGNSDDCNDGLICGVPNITGSVPPHLRVHGPHDKICLCDVENGYREKDHTCSDADILKTSIFAIVIVSCIRKVLVY